MTRARHSWYTTCAVFLAVAVAASLIPYATAAAEVRTNWFNDDDSSVHEPAIDAVARAGFVRGCNPPTNDRFCPDRPLTRAEMATILTRVGDLPRPSGPHAHKDTSGSVHIADIDAISAAGVTFGCNPPAGDRFCPDRLVTRGQMAAFLYRLEKLEPAPHVFRDAVGHEFSSEIGALADLGVLRGCNPPTNDRVCPDDAVSRGEAASMVARLLDLEQIAVDHPDEPELPGVVPPPDAPPGNEPPAGGGDYPGQPPAGQVLWGAHVEGNADPYARHESVADATMTLNRTFYQWSQRTAAGLRENVEGDVANGRVPWVSFKPPSCSGCEIWAEVANGGYDAQIDEMLRYLDGLSGPVWLTIHHEPENDSGMGSPADHLAMNRRVRQRMNALGTDNIALTVVLMSWTWDTRSGRNPNQWWAGDVYDFVGVDPYVCQDNASDCQRDSILDDLNGGNGWSTIRRWASDRNVDVAVAEWGMRGSDANAANRVREWYTAAVNSATDGGGARVVGLAAFDSGQNSPGGTWRLEGGQLSEFHTLMADSRTAHP